MGAPALQGILAFGKELMTLIDRRNAGDCPRLVVRTLSATCGATPSLAMPETQVRRKSWRRQSETSESLSSSRLAALKL
jgi:hypothetical protein